MPPTLCYVTDRRTLAGRTAGEAVRAAVAAGVDWVQIREKDLPTLELLAVVRDAVAAARGSSTRILVNDRLDVALAAGAGGVHLGRESLPAAAVAAAFRPGPASSVSADCARLKAAATAFMIGVSCHSLEEAQQAERGGADYIFFGPVFATPSKAAFGPPQGLERLAHVCAAVRIPVLAIGGVTAENARECRRAGAAGIAAIRLFQQCGDWSSLASRLRT
jgi:thiamine-phosphate pyrophosphorylase